MQYGEDDIIAKKQERLHLSSNITEQFADNNSEGLFMKKSLSIFCAVFLVASQFLVACGAENIGNTSSTKKIITPTMVTKLYSETEYTFSIVDPENYDVSWMAILTSAEHSKFFQITEVKTGGAVVVKDGLNGFVSNTGAIIQNISVVGSGTDEDTTFDGNISTGLEKGLQITVKYSPFEAPASGEVHKAPLVIYKKDGSSILVTLKGVPQGILEEPCNQAPASMRVFQYKASPKLHVCDPQVAEFDLANDTEHGSSTNVTDLEEFTITFYSPDEDTFCLLEDGDPSSIGTVVIPIPDVGVEISSMDAFLQGRTECTLADGFLNCADGVPLVVKNDLLLLKPFGITNGTFTKAETVSSRCSDFGEFSGSGTFDPYGENGDVTFVLKSEVLDNVNAAAYEVVGMGLFVTLSLTPL